MTSRELNEFIVKSILLIIIWIIALIPTEICGFLWFAVLHPETFWEKFAVISVMMIVGGATQFGLAILGVFLSGFVLFEMK